MDKYRQGNKVGVDESFSDEHDVDLMNNEKGNKDGLDLSTAIGQSTALADGN